MENRHFKLVFPASLAGLLILTLFGVLAQAFDSVVEPSSLTSIRTDSHRSTLEQIPAVVQATITPSSTLTVQPTIALENVTTMTAVTTEVNLPSGTLLDRLTHNKPGIWGNKAFYVGLTVAYVVLLGFFFRLVIQMARRQE